MRSVSNLIAQKTGSFIGDYRCRSPHWVTPHDKGGKRYRSLYLEDFSGSIEAIAIEGEHLSPDNLYEMDGLMVSGDLRHSSNGRVVANLHGISRMCPDEPGGARILPVSMCPKADCLQELVMLEEGIGNKALQTFVRNVLSNDSIAQPFIRLPASLRHHHNEPGGLLEHSLECASIVSGHQGFDPDMLELGMIAALFHDIGKIRTFRDDKRRSQEGYVLHHDALTLETLADALSELERSWKDGATALRYLWTWSHGYNNPLPLMPVAIAVQAADRISAGRDAEKQAFATEQSGHNFAQLNCNGRKNRFWRPRQSFPNQK